jgi:hypothetical protein
VQIERNLSLYEGEWKADKEHGRGVKIWRDGSASHGCDLTYRHDMIIITIAYVR